MKNISSQAGFTFVEIIVVTVILAIVAAIGTTLLMNTLPNMRLKSAARDLFSVMMQAKSEAIRRGENVTVLFTPPPANLLFPLPPANTYTVFLDRQPSPNPPSATDDNEVLDANETVLVAATPLPNRVTFDPAFGGGDGVTFAGTAAGREALVFTPRGIPVSATAAPGAFVMGPGSVQLCTIDSAGNPTATRRTIAVSSAGRINMD